MCRDDAEAVARLHCAVLSDGFLVQLGPSVLVHVYAGALGAPGVVGLVVEENREIVGFLLATTDTRALFRHVLVRRGPRLAGAVMVAALRRPGAIGRVLETVRYPARRASADQSPRAELISIGVGPQYRDRGHGAALIETLNWELADRGVGAYTVSVYADNAQGNGLYQRLGFEFTHHFEMYGRRWAAYRFALPAAARPDEPERRVGPVSAGRIPLG